MQKPLAHHKASMAEDALSTLLEALNARRTGPDRWIARCPAHDDRDPSLSIAYKSGRILLYCFAGCSTEAVLGALGLSWKDLGQMGFRPWTPQTPPRLDPFPERPEEAQRKRWQAWWKEAKPDHPLLQRYLTARGLTLPPPPTLRLASWKKGPVMLAQITGPGGELLGMHLTELAKDGTARLSKRFAKGSRPAFGAVRLYPIEEKRPLVLAEGIETALAMRGLTGLPVWAATSASLLPKVILPPEAKEVWIAPDHDEPGLKAAEALAKRLTEEGRKVHLSIPPKPGQDWLDALLEAPCYPH